MPQIKKLIEVSLPLEAINAESAREKSIRHGHPSTLHLWWARRPLAAARAVLFASLVDDPSSHPELFPTEALQDQERERLHRLLAELVKWENSGNEALLKEARAEIGQCMGEEKLVFLDPFAGGGAIPLEAQRLGMEAHAHDLNPVAVMINKAMLEIPPKFAGKPPVNPAARESLAGLVWPGAAGLADDVAYYGKWMKEEADRAIGHLYPKVKLPQGGEANVIAWIWARTAQCPNPACGCQMPLASSFVLSRKKGSEAWIEPLINGKNITYAVHNGKCPPDKETCKLGKGAIFRCPVCGATTDKKYIHDEFIAKKSGAVLMAIVAENKKGRCYLAPDKIHEEIANSAVPAWTPEEEMDTKCTDLVSGRGYGITHWKQLFTPRQLTALATFSDLVAKAQARAEKDAIDAGMPDDGIGLAEGGKGAKAYGEAIGVYLAFVVDKLADYNSAICSWHSSRILIRNTFGRQAIPMVWDYAESNPFCNSSGSYDNMLDWVARCIRKFPASAPGHVSQQQAQAKIPESNIIISSDPPYYDNIGYADLSDYFYIWLRQALKRIYPAIFKTMLVPKAEELVATPYRFDGDRRKAREFFENGMKQAFAQMRDAARDDAPVTIYYAFRQSETDAENDETASTGWETMLSAIIEAGFAITGTWPMRTEMANRQIACDTNALASSIVLVCRKRPKDAPCATRRQFMAELKKALPPAIRKMQTANIAPVDLAQAAIGPGMEIYSRYSRVLEADGQAMSARQALQAINAGLDEYFTAQEGRLDEASRFCVDLYSQYAFRDADFGVAEVLAKAKNTSIDKLAQMGALVAQKGLVRLIGRDGLPAKPAKAAPLSGCLWLLTQHLVKALAQGGLTSAAALVNDYEAEAEDGRRLAYRLFAIADRKGWSKEAFDYNALVTAWPEVLEKAADLKNLRAEQGTL